MEVSSPTYSVHFIIQIIPNSSFPFSYRCRNAVVLCKQYVFQIISKIFHIKNPVPPLLLVCSKHHPYADDSQIYISKLNCPPELQSCIIDLTSTCKKLLSFLNFTHLKRGEKSLTPLLLQSAHPLPFSISVSSTMNQ